MNDMRERRQSGAVIAGLVGLIVIVGYAAVGILQILVWNPLAAVPGATLEQIYAQLDLANESLATSWVVTWGVIGVVLAGAVLLVSAVGRTRPVSFVVAADLLLLVLAAPAHLFVAFGPGMSLADTFMISGGDHAPWGVALYLVSALALTALVIRVVLAKYDRRALVH
ncbi:hypothetical protein [Cryobacterium sp. CG_9.6]|uniref:hypothetical protein n=1 Tax=Cryobacterium sp. CG_9.6 TaxID=2760710 RepID=UPI002476B94C|nr:hypothetical protein [Cryobacterium sp. CG_9.6]MDH6237351.1 hypothetical protein [Cryobacterium sp. CG_9.6]